MTTNYPEQITIDVDARLHLQHTDVDEANHYIQEVSGTVISYPNAGEYEVSLSPANEVRFSQITSAPCIIVVIMFILDWPKMFESYESAKREMRNLPDPENFLDMSDGEYTAFVRLNFDDGYAFKRCVMEKLGDNYYKATIDTVHRYPSTKSLNLIRILPHDITLTDAGPGHIIGRSQVRWLKNDGSIVTGDAEIEVFLNDKFRRLPMTEIYSYEYEHSAFNAYPFLLSATSKMLAVDNPPRKVAFDEVTRTYGDEIIE